MGPHTDNNRWITPPRVAEQFGVNVNKVLKWIGDGELAAVDVSEHPGIGRPRWRISADALEAFIQARSNRARIAPKPAPRRRRATGVVQYV